MGPEPLWTLKVELAVAGGAAILGGGATEEPCRSSAGENLSRLESTAVHLVMSHWQRGEHAVTGVIQLVVGNGSV